jgi:hypothetical protein
MTMFNLTTHRFNSIFSATAFVLAACLAAGCSSPSPESYQTEESRAREALEASLEAWKMGKPSGPVGALSGGGPQVQAIDSDWTAGRKLASYEIGEETPGADSMARRFSVKLTYDKQTQPIQAEYHVVGVDPILVFRDKDYAQSQGM